MSIFGAAEQVVNDVVDTAEDVVDTVVDAAEDAADTGSQSGAGTVVEIIIAIVTAAADGVAPAVNEGLANVKGKAGVAINTGAGVIRDARDTSHRLMNNIAAMTTSVLAVVVSLTADMLREDINKNIAMLHIVADIAGHTLATKRQQIDSEIDRLQREMSVLKVNIARLAQELERLNAVKEREKRLLFDAKSSAIQHIITRLRAAAAALSDVRNAITSGQAFGDGDATEKEYQSAAELARRLDALVGRLALVLRRRAAANPRLMLAQGALQRLSAHLQVSNANLLQARSAVLSRRVQTPINLRAGFQKPLTRA